MRKLSEIKNEEALDVLADLLNPIAELSKDDGLKKIYKNGGKLPAVQYAIKNHKKAVLEMLAILDGENPETYEVNMIQIPIKVTELLNDEDVLGFFQSQGLIVSGASSGSVTENIKEAEVK